MNVNTGAIVAMASYPDYDLNSPGTILDGTLQEQLDETLADLAAPPGGTMRRRRSTRAAVSKAESDAVNSQWRNRMHRLHLRARLHLQAHHPGHGHRGGAGEPK